MRDESGFTLVELMMGIVISMISLTMVTMIINVAVHGQDRISKRVAANQRARPVLTRIVDELHSACVTRGTTPIVSGKYSQTSTPTKMAFITKSGSAVSLNPDMRVLTLSGGSLSESVYPWTSGTTPLTWAFAATPSSTQTLLTNVAAPSDGQMFKYYRFTSGQLSSTPMSMTSGSLSSTDAGFAAYVSINMVVSPSGGASRLDANSPITLSDAVDLRLQPASQLAGQDNLPCA